MNNTEKITVITGHYGSGKTNHAINLAKESSKKNIKTAVIDMDIVNPYFRTADFEGLFKSAGISLYAPAFANSNLDIPALNFNLEKIVAENDYVILDVGGDDSGAIVLGQYRNILAENDTEVLYVVNAKRYLTHNADEIIEVMKEIEEVSHITHTAVVNNTNLGEETTSETVLSASEIIEDVSAQTGLPVRFHCCPDEIFSETEKLTDKKLMPVKIYVRKPW